MIKIHHLLLIFCFVAGGSITACQNTPSSDIATPAQEAKPVIKYCGGFTSSDQQQSCDIPDEYCHRDIKDMCGAADAPGVCKPRPEICTQEYAPVCGCDGQTYSNACVANGSGVSVAAIGECT